MSPGSFRGALMKPRPESLTGRAQNTGIVPAMRLLAAVAILCLATRAPAQLATDEGALIAKSDSLQAEALKALQSQFSAAKTARVSPAEKTAAIDALKRRIARTRAMATSS